MYKLNIESVYLHLNCFLFLFLSLLSLSFFLQLTLLLSVSSYTYTVKSYQHHSNIFLVSSFVTVNCSIACFCHMSTCYFFSSLFLRSRVFNRKVHTFVLLNIFHSLIYTFFTFHSLSLSLSVIHTNFRWSEACTFLLRTNLNCIRLLC